MSPSSGAAPLLLLPPGCPQHQVEHMGPGLRMHRTLAPWVPEWPLASPGVPSPMATPCSRAGIPQSSSPVSSWLHPCPQAMALAQVPHGMTQLQLQVPVPGPLSPFHVPVAAPIPHSMSQAGTRAQRGTPWDGHRLPVGPMGADGGLPALPEHGTGSRPQPHLPWGRETWVQLMAGMGQGWMRGSCPPRDEGDGRVSPCRYLRPAGVTAGPPLPGPALVLVLVLVVECWCWVLLLALGAGRWWWVLVLVLGVGCWVLVVGAGCRVLVLALGAG